MKRPFSERESQALFSLRTLGLLSSLMLVPVLAGCPGTLDPRYLNATGGGTGGMVGMGGTGGADAVLMDCPDAPAKLATGCGGAACHISTFAAVWGDFSTLDGMLAARLINKVATASPVCNGQTKLVNPTKPASGVLFERLTTTNCGGRQMPPPESTPDQLLSDAARASLVACLKGWLTPQLQ